MNDHRKSVVILSAWVDPVLRDYARHAAKAEGLTFSAWVSRAVQQAVFASSVERAMRDAETRELIEAKGGG